MTIRDLVTYEPKITQLVTDLETIETLREDNIDCLLRYFRKGPMTIRELVDEFKNEGMIKSESSVYRYVQKMIQTKVAVKAGKRITSINEDEIRSETLYSRTAKVFLIVDTFKKVEPALEKIDEQIFILTKKLLLLNYKDKKINDKKLAEFMEEIVALRYENLSNLIDDADESVLELFKDLEFPIIQYILEFVSWLSIIDKPEFHDLFNASFK